MGSIHQLIFGFVLYVLEIPIKILAGGGCDMRYRYKLQFFTVYEREPKDLRMSVGPNLKLVTRLSWVPVTMLRAEESPFKNLWDGQKWQSRVPGPKLTCPLQRLSCAAPWRGSHPSGPRLCSPGTIPTGGMGGAPRSFSDWTLENM